MTSSAEGRTSPRLVSALAVLAVPVLLSVPAAPAGATETATNACPSPDDPFIDQSSPGLINTGFPQSWDLGTGAGVTVAVVDSGVDVGNPHLGPEVVLPGTSFVSGPGVAADGRADIQGHGTAVASIIAGQVVEDSDQIGAAFDAKILPVQVYRKDDLEQSGTPGEPSTPLMAAGIRWAADNGADVINISMSTDGFDADLEALQDAVDHAADKDVVVVASAGNNDPDEGEELAPLYADRWPAAHDRAIGVAATNEYGAVDDWTVHGAGTDVAAPGKNVLAASVVSGGDCFAGRERPYSSWAAPFVAALAAQLRERYPDESAEEITYRILAAADRQRLGSSDQVQGWGEVRPYESLAMTIDPAVPGPPLPPGYKRDRPEAVEQVEALGAPVDPWADAREAALWWGLGGVGLTALALIVRPMTRRRATPAPG